MTMLLPENLPLLTSAPNGIKKLRELILEMAVRGKLVPQDPSDEPASELLKRIAEEKARLVAEGKIKKQKPLAEIDEQAQPFDLPMDWVWTPLGEITNFGITTKKDEIPDDAWVLDLEDIEKDTSRLLQKARFYERNSLSDKNSFTKGDVLYGKLRPYLNKVLVAEEDGFCTTEILPFRCYGPFVAHYFMIVLKSPYFLNYVNAKSYGMKMPRLGTEDGRQAFFPLPPLVEQNRIAAKVDELMALCDRLEAQQADAESAHTQLVQALLDSLTQASDSTDFSANWQRLAEHFHTLFTTEPSIDALKQTLLQLAVMGKLVPQHSSDEPASELLNRIAQEKARLVTEGKLKKQKPLAEIAEFEKTFELPESWEWVRLEEIAQVGTGATPLRTNPKYFEPATINWVTSGETSQDHIHETAQKVSPLALTETNLTVYPPHTLVIAMYGQGKTRGQISELLIDACTNQACAAIQLFDQDESHRYYVKYFFIKSYDDIRLLAAGGAQPNLNLGKIKETVLPLPPAAEQHRIVATVDQLMALCEQLKTRLTQASQLNEQLADTLVEQTVA